MAQKPDAKMIIWEQVKTTNPDFTKTQALEGRQVTSINGMYVVQRATETFGPIGKGWGYEILIDRFDKGAPILDKDGAVIAHEQVHTIQIKLWYLHAGKRNSVIHYGHTPFVRKSTLGSFTDFDAPKKSLTDAIKKCLSMLGFSADVHMGMFEDEIYLEGLELKKRLDEAGDPESVLHEVKGEFKDWLSRQITALERAPNIQALTLMSKQLVETARAKAEVVNYAPSEVERLINEARDAREQYLQSNPPRRVLASEELDAAKE